MNKKHRRTLSAVFDDPVRSNIRWREIEAMLDAGGAEITEGDNGAVRSMRRFLAEAGVTP